MAAQGAVASPKQTSDLKPVPAAQVAAAGNAQQLDSAAVPVPSPIRIDSAQKTVAMPQSSAALQPNVVAGGEAATGTAKQLVVRLQGEGGENISVRLSDQGGQIQVSVRSSDLNTATALRQDLGSLATSLGRSGLSVDTPAFSGSNEASKQQHSGQPEQQSQDGSRRQDADWSRQQNRGRQSSADRWDELLLQEEL
jgi:flagellar hook-length control protein FliK